MNRLDADLLGHRIAPLIVAGKYENAHALLCPVLQARTPFPILGRIGAVIGDGPIDEANRFLERIATDRTMGGWVIIGTALGRQMDRDHTGAFSRCRQYLISADVWYGADILGERVPGPGLLATFKPTLNILAQWRDDDNAWVRRAVGVGVHFWAKRSRGAAAQHTAARSLLALLDPMFEEKHKDAVKGVGWGLKTLGRYYPDLAAEWLTQQLHHRRRSCRKMMLRKALTYLPDKYRSRFES